MSICDIEATATDLSPVPSRERLDFGGGAAGDTQLRFALAAQPGGSQRRTATNPSSRLIVRIPCPHLRAPGASVPDGRTIRHDHDDRGRTSAPRSSYRLLMPSNGCTRSSNADQNPDRAAVPGDRGGAVLGAARLRQITMRKVDGWQTLATKPADAVIDLAA